MLAEDGGRVQRLMKANAIANLHEADQRVIAGNYASKGHWTRRKWTGRS
jgi:hypothetical protein